jgi:hypothetical protein
MDTELPEANGVETTAEETPKKEREEAQAGPREVAAAVLVVVVLLAGVAYAYYQGFNAGVKTGREEGIETVHANAAVLPLAMKGARPYGGFEVLEDQEVVLTVKGPGDVEQRNPLQVSPGDRIAIMVIPAGDL